MDILDFLTEKDEGYFLGTYYGRRPKTTQDEGFEFSYNEVDNMSETVGSAISNLETPEERYTISTVERLLFSVKGYIVTQDGNLWQIEQKQTKPYKAQKEAFRLWKTSAKIETTLRLILVENGWALK